MCIIAIAFYWRCADPAGSNLNSKKMSTTNPFESPTSSSASDDEENGRNSPCLEIRASSSSGNSSAYFEDCLVDNDDEDIGEFRRDQCIATPAPPGVFNDQLHSLLSGQHQDTNRGIANTASYDSAKDDYISPLEAALLYGVVSPASYNGCERDDEDESEEDDSRGLLSPAPSGGSWWNRIVDTFSPTPSKIDYGDRSGMFTQVDSSSDDASFKSARSKSSGGDGSDDIDHEAYHKTSQDPPPSLSVQFHQTTPARTPIRNSSSQQFNTMKTPMSRRSSKRKKRRSVRASGLLGGRQNVLEDIGGSHAANSEFTLDYHSPGTPWTKVILLEELGTASSWLVLLLPYISFLIALALDSTSILQNVTLDPRSGEMPCSGTTNQTEIFPLVPIPSSSCSYPYRIQEGAGLLSYVNARNEVVDRRYEFYMSLGEAVTSGPIKDVPAMSSFLYGDMIFAGLSSDAISLVTKGSVLTSTAVFQRRIDDDDDYASNERNLRQEVYKKDEEWFPVSISEPRRLDMVCNYYSKKTSWNCTSPQTVDVLFSLPATAVLTGGDIRVDTIFSYYPLRPYDSWNRRLSKKGDMASLTADDILSGADTSDPSGILKELSRASAYILRHQRPAYAETIVIVRLISLTISFCFLVYWITKIGFTGFCCNRGNELFHDDQEDSDNESDCCIGSSSCERWERKVEDGLVTKKKKRGNLNWWESPWIVMPERRYLLIVLICLLMVQNPLLAVAFYKPKLFSSAQMHVAADCLVSSEV